MGVNFQAKTNNPLKMWMTMEQHGFRPEVVSASQDDDVVTFLLVTDNQAAYAQYKKYADTTLSIAIEAV